MKLSAFDVLQVTANDDDETIRQAYLSLVHDFSPEHDPARFQLIRDAYEKIATEEDRLRYALFEVPATGFLNFIEALLKQGAASSLTAAHLEAVLREAIHDNA